VRVETEREALAHEKLDLYRLSKELAVDLYRDTASFPAEERFGLSSQIRRATVSIPANVPEGAARRSKREFARFPLMARGSAAELRVLLEVAREVGLLEEGRYHSAHETVDRLSSMTSGLIRQLRSRS
jgi:four helix bundle protein